MHFANAKSASFWLSEIGGGAPPPPNSLHVFTAAWNAGPLKLTPKTVTVELPGVLEIDIPSSPLGPFLGSGKFGTPCARMQLEIAAGEASELDEAAGLELELPQAAIASPALTAASAIDRLWRGLFGTVHVRALRASFRRFALAGRSVVPDGR
jgi:hypothetical protein